MDLNQSSAFKRGVACYENADQLSSIAQSLVESKDERVLHELKKQAVEQVAIHHNDANTSANHTGEQEEEIRHLKELGPFELAREMAWKAEEVYGTAKRHFDITVLEVGAAAPNSKGAAASEGITKANTEINTFLEQINSKVAALELFIEIQVPGPSYYRKRAQSKSPAQHHGIGGGIGFTPSSSFFGANSNPSVSRTNSGIPKIDDIANWVVVPEANANTNKKKPAAGTKASSKNDDYDPLDALSIQVPTGSIGDWKGGGEEEGADKHEPNAKTTGSGNASKKTSGQTSLEASGRYQLDDQKLAAADDYMALLMATTAPTPSAAPKVSPRRPAPPSHNQNQSEPVELFNSTGPVMGMPVSKNQPPTVDTSANQQAQYLSGGYGSTSPMSSDTATSPSGAPVVSYAFAAPEAPQAAQPNNYSYNPASYSYTPGQAQGGGYSYNPPPTNQGYSYTPGQAAAPHAYDPSGVYSQRPVIHVTQPPPPTSYPTPVAQPPLPLSTSKAPQQAAADDYLSLLAGTMGTGSAKPAAKAAPTDKEYLTILEQLAATKKKAQQIAMVELKAKEKETEKSKPDPIVAPTSPSTGGGGGGGGGGKKTPGGAPPPMSTSFKSLIGDLSTLGSVKNDESGGLSGNAINARNAAHSLSSAGANYAPKTSQFVLKGIEVSTTLLKQGQHKKSVDILQHVFDQGKLETHNTRTFEASMTAAITDGRRKYYQAHPPRLLQGNPISDEEMRILQSSGKTSTAFFPIWDDVGEGYAAENVYYPTRPQAVPGSSTPAVAPPWEDPFSPLLSDKQKKAGARWIRAPKLLEQFADRDVGGAPMSPPPTSAVTPTTDPTSAEIAGPAAPVSASVGLITTCDPMAIKQTIVGDCSLVCSLIVCASFQRRFPQARIISHVIFPQEEGAGTQSDPSSLIMAQPVVNAAGKYCVKMLVNGITRMVVLDDRLPAIPGTDKHLPLLACSYSTDPREMWVTLMEKAFVKVCGGTYDFPGSNSSTDLYHLSGWLPDYLAMDNTKFDANLQWQRMVHSHRKGGLIATLNTPSNMDKQTSEKLKLIPGHAYAILDFRETYGGRHKLVKIKNPWTKDNPWEGQFSPKDTERMTPELRSELAFTDDETKRGVFWMSWEDVTRYFSRIHLSWNPYCLYSGSGGGFVKPTRIARHDQWTYTNAMTQMPQYDIVAKNLTGRNSRMHLVLSRHILNLDEYNIKAGKKNVTPPLPNGNVFDQCPQAPSSPTGDGDGNDPADYVPLITVHIYNTSPFPSVAQSVIDQEPVGSVCGGSSWPAEGSQAILAQLSAGDKGGKAIMSTPLTTVIERLPTLPGSVGVATTGSTKGPTHMTASFTGRRIDNSSQFPSNSEGPEAALAEGGLVHNGVYKNVPHQTISFDCPPTSGSEVRRFTVVVTQLLPKAEREAKVGSKVPFPALRTFPFSLTLHTELPQMEKETSAALLSRSSSMSQAMNKSFVNMTSIPTMGQLPFVSRVKAHWIGGMNCGGKIGARTFGFNPQFLLTIPQPANAPSGASGPSPLTHLIAKVSSPSATETVQIHVVCLKDEIASLITQQQAASTSNASHPTIPPWFGRLYNITDTEAKFVLSSESYRWQTASVDTSLSSCLQFDDTNTLKRPESAAPTRQAYVPPPTPSAPPPPAPTGLPKLLPVALKPANLNVPNSSFFFPFPRQKTALLLLPLVADGILAVPAHTKAIYGGQQIPFIGGDGSTSSAQTFAQIQQAGALIVPSSVAVDQKLGDVFKASSSQTIESTAKMMGNAGTTPTSVLQLVTIVPATESISEYFKRQGDATAAELSKLWGDIIILAQRIMAEFAAWYQCSDWGDAASALPLVAFQGSPHPPSVMCANQYLSRRFAPVPTSNPASRSNAEKATKLLNEEVLQLLTRIDKFGIDTGSDEELRAARKAMVSIAQSILHEATDELSKAFADVDRLTAEGPIRAPASPTAAPTRSSPNSRQITSASMPLNRLPAGQYIVAVSQWASGTPAPFEMLIETEVPHVLTELPPEGSDASPDDTAGPAEKGKLVGYKKWSTVNLNGTFGKTPNAGGVDGFIKASPLYSKSLSLGHGLFQAYPSICIFIPSSAAPLTLAARVVISPPADATDQERLFPPKAIGSGQLLLFTEPPDGNALLVADSGDCESAVDIGLIVTNNKTLAATSTGGKSFGSDGGCTKINHNTAQFVGGRKYRLLMILRPAVSFRNDARVQFLAKVYCSTAGTTATLSTK